MRSIVVATLLAATAAVPAFAQDTAAPFTGPRVEALVGVDQLRGLGHNEGVTYGAGVGYDVQVRGPSGPIFGIEASLTDSNAKLCAGATAARECQKAGRDIYVGGRVGAPVLPKTLIYAKAGYTNASFTQDRVTAGTNVRLRKGDYDGWRIGGGVEYAVTQNMFVKAEATVSDYTDGFTRRQAVAGFGMRF